MSNKYPNLIRWADWLDNIYPGQEGNNDESESVQFLLHFCSDEDARIAMMCEPFFKSLDEIAEANNVTVEEIASTLEECDDTLLDDREKYWITKYNSYKDGYNGTCGGQNIFISHSQKVSEFSLTGEFIRTFESAKDAAKEKQVDPTNIRQCCNEKYKTCANSIWQWGEETTLKREIVLNNRYRPVR